MIDRPNECHTSGGRHVRWRHEETRCGRAHLNQPKETECDGPGRANRCRAPDLTRIGGEQYPTAASIPACDGTIAILAAADPTISTYAPATLLLETNDASPISGR
jgi:hypothetical protein